MQLPRSKPSRLVYNFNPDEKRKIYNTLVMLAYLMDIINPPHQWERRLFSLIIKHKVNVRAMGFPGDYAERPIWKM